MKFTGPRSKTYHGDKFDDMRSRALGDPTRTVVLLETCVQTEYVCRELCVQLGSSSMRIVVEQERLE